MTNIGITLHIRGRKGSVVTDEDASDVASEAIFYAQTLFFFLTMLRPSVEPHDGRDMAEEFENLGKLGNMLLSAALTHVWQLEEARKGLATAPPEEGGVQ